MSSSLVDRARGTPALALAPAAYFTPLPARLLSWGRDCSQHCHLHASCLWAFACAPPFSLLRMPVHPSLMVQRLRNPLDMEDLPICSTFPQLPQCLSPEQAY